MAESPSPTSALVPLRRQRDLVIERLTEHFSRDHLDVEEFERRVDQAHAATSLTALERLTSDLAPLDAAGERQVEAVADRRRDAGALALADRPRSKSILAIFGGSERKGTWRVPEKLRVVAMFGGVTLDFREVALPPGVTEVSVLCLAGGCEILVPPHLNVECEGTGILGGFDSFARSPSTPGPDEPILRISGAAIMGGVGIESRLPGESGREARKRRRRELKDARRRELPAGD